MSEKEEWVQGLLADVELLEEIKMASRAAVGAFVEDRTDKDGRVSKNALANFVRLGGFTKEPYMKALEVSNPATFVTIFVPRSGQRLQVAKHHDLPSPLVVMPPAHSQTLLDTFGNEPWATSFDLSLQNRCAQSCIRSDTSIFKLDAHTIDICSSDTWVWTARPTARWGVVTQGTKFSKANLNDMRLLFTYLEFCLEQIVKDNELGALKQGLDGGYVQPGPGGDPIRNPKVRPWP